MKKLTNLGSDNIVKLMLKLAIPAMLAQFVNVLYGIVDRIFIGNIPEIGDIALSGVGVCAPIITLITSFSFLVGLGGAPLLSMRMGENKLDKAKDIVANSFLMLIVISVILTIVLFFIRKPMLMFFGASVNTIEYADGYLSIYILGNIFALLSIGLNSYITAQGFSKIAMCTVLVGAVLNIILDPIFIFVCDWGVQGAALATIISQAISCVWVVAFLLGKKTLVKLSLKNLSIKEMLRIMKLGFSPFLIIATDSIVLIAFNSVLQKYGGAGRGDLLIMTATIVVSYMQIITMPMGGITMGASPVISYNFGAGNIDKVKKAFVILNIICIAFTTIMFIISMSIPQLFARLFTSDPVLLASAAWGIRVFTAGIIFLAVQYACVDGMTALGQASIAVTLSLTRKMVIMLSLIFIIPRIYGAEATFWAEPIADCIAALLSGTTTLILLKKILKRKQKMLLQDNTKV